MNQERFRIEFFIHSIKCANFYIEIVRKENGGSSLERELRNSVLFCRLPIQQQPVRIKWKELTSSATHRKELSKLLNTWKELSKSLNTYKESSMQLNTWKESSV